MFGDVPDLVLLKSFALLLAISHQFVEIFLQILEHKVGFVDDSYDFFELNDVGVVHLAQCFDF